MQVERGTRSAVVRVAVVRLDLRADRDRSEPEPDDGAGTEQDPCAAFAVREHVDERGCDEDDSREDAEEPLHAAEYMRAIVAVEGTDETG